MFARIKNDDVLSKLIQKSCCEEGICADIDGSIGNENYIIIKPDLISNSLPPNERTPLTDCIIIVRCGDGRYVLNIVELKSGRKKAGNFDFENIIQKYECTLNDFISKRFKGILHLRYKSVNLYFVSKLENNKRDSGTRLEALIGKIFKYDGNRYMVKPHKPNPIISAC